jgi:hypothetical protein
MGSAGDDEDKYTMQIGVISESCNKLTTLTLTINAKKGSKLNNTFKILSFFDAETGDATGAIAEQKVSPISQSLLEIESGTAKIVDKGNKLFSIDVSAKLPGNSGTTTMKGDVQF